MALLISSRISCRDGWYWRRFAIFLLALGAVYAESPRASGGEQSFSEYDIKAAYLINFAKYVEWPADAFEDDEAPFTIGILGKNPFGDTLKSLASEQALHGRRVEVKRSDDASDLTSCQIVFVPKAAGQTTRDDLATFADRPILTVGEEDEFTENGGVINFLIVETKVKFEINLKSAKRANLKVSSRLLRVAEEVLE